MADAIVERALGPVIKSGPRDARVYSLRYIGLTRLIVTAELHSTYLSLIFTHPQPSSVPASQLEAACAALCSYGLKLWFAFDKSKGVIGRLAIFSINDMTEEKLRSICDDAARDFARMESMLVEHVNIPIAVEAEERVALIEIWDVVCYFRLRQYQITCGKDWVKMKAEINFKSKGRCICAQHLIIEYRSASELITVFIVYAGKETFSKAHLTSLGLTLPELSVSAENIRIGVRVPLSGNLIPYALHIMKKYMHVIAFLVEKGEIDCKSFPVGSESVLHTGVEDPNFTLVLKDLESLELHLPAMSDFYPQLLPVIWRAKCFQETVFKTPKDFLLAQQGYTTLKQNLRNHSMFLQLQIFIFDELRRAVAVDLSLLQRFSEIRNDEISLERLEQLVLEMIAFVEEMQTMGYGIAKLAKTWCLHNGFTGSAIVPEVTQKGLSVFQTQASAPGALVLWSLKTIPIFQQWVSFAQARRLLPSATEISSFEPFQESNQKEFLRTTEESLDSLPLFKLICRKHWTITVPNRAYAPSAPVQVLIKRTLAESILYVRPPLIDFSNMQSILTLPDDAQCQAIAGLLECLSVYHSKDIAHLLLIPPLILCGKASKPVLVDMQFSYYNLFAIYETSPQYLNYMDFIDPCVISYLYWKTKSGEKVKVKKLKYLFKLNVFCDIYSVGMLMYSYIWADDHPFAYVGSLEERKEILRERPKGAKSASSTTGDYVFPQAADAFPISATEKVYRDYPIMDPERKARALRRLEEFFIRVVKPHRSPLISEEFEKEFPKFTDVLRRCFMRQASRPKLEELKEFVKDLQKMKTFVAERRLSVNRRDPILRSDP